MNKAQWLLAFTWLSTTALHSQKLHPLEEANTHYKILAQLPAGTNRERAALDTISFPTRGRTSGKQYVGIEPSYLTLENVNQLRNSITFPANSSDQTQAEIDFLLEWERKRTEAHRDRVLEIARIGYWPPLEKDSRLFGSNVDDLFWEGREVLGPACTKEKYPATLTLLAGVTRDMRIMEFTVKYHLLRARPYHLEPALNPMARISSPSFASGHTLWAYIQAFTWSELIPAKRKEFLALAYEVGESREIMGIHFPSDEEAARILAHKMLEMMWTNPEFIRDLRAAKKEWQDY